MRLKLEIENGKEIAKKLEQAGEKGVVIVREAATRAIELAKDEIVRNTPHDSGDLAEGFETKPGSKKKGGANAVVTIKDRSLVYAFYLELGAPNRKRGGTLPARPFIRPAFDRKKREAVAEFEKLLKKRLGLE